MANWTSFLPQAEKWVSGLGLHPLYGHPHKKKKAKKIRIHKAHLTNHLVGQGKHPSAMSSSHDPFRRSKGDAYKTK